MTGLEALDFFKEINKRKNHGNGDIWLQMYIDAIEKELKALEVLKPRICFKESSIKNCGKKYKVIFIKTSGFVFYNNPEHKILKEVFENESK